MHLVIRNELVSSAKSTWNKRPLLVSGTSRRSQPTESASVANVESCCSWTQLHYLHPGASTVLPLFVLTAHQKWTWSVPWGTAWGPHVGPHSLPPCLKKGSRFSAHTNFGFQYCKWWWKFKLCPGLDMFFFLYRERA